MRFVTQEIFEAPRDQATLDEDLIIHRRSTTQNTALLIFVHGLGGSRYGENSTWGNFPAFIYKDFPDVDVGLYEYRTLLRRAKFWKSVTLKVEGEVFGGIIRDATDYQMVILVGHSEGGLLCMEVIRFLINSGQSEHLRRFAGLGLMATPQAGSQRVPGFMSWFSKDFYVLRPHGDFVTDIHEVFVNFIEINFDELRTRPDRFTIPTFAVLGGEDRWVDKLSAGLSIPGKQKKTVHGSHTEIVKPSHEQADAYLFVKACIEKCIIRHSQEQHEDENHVDKPIAVAPSQLPSIADEPPLIPSDLAPAVGVFINRQEHIKAIQEFLADDARRLVVVQGLPGIGKTLLAAKLAEALRARFKAVLWITCKDDQVSPDVLFAKLHAFFEENGEQGLRNIWNNPSPDQLQMKINRLIHALDENSYLLIFDEFQNWLAPDFQLKNPEVRQVLATIFGTVHKSKILLISDQRPLLDPIAFRLPVGSTLERTLLGLSKPDAIQLLNVTGLKIEDEALLNRIVEHCYGNPYMLQIFSYLVSGLHRDPEELLSSGETGTKFNSLLQAAIKDLSQDSRSALETLSIVRLPLSQRQLQAIDFRFDKVIGPLLDRFLVIEEALIGNTQSRKFGVSTVVRNFMRQALSEARRHVLHKQAVPFYVEQRGGRVPENYEELQFALEEGYHRFEYGDSEGGAHVITSVTPLLVDWGYINLAEQNILQALKNTENQGLKAECYWLQGIIADLRSDYSGALEHFKDALQLYESTDNYSGIARTLFRIGRIHNALNQFDTANEHFQRCIHTCEEHSVTDGWAASLLGMAWNLQERSSDMEKVLKLYQQSIERAEQSNDLETLSSAHRQIGFLLATKRGQKDEAQEHYKKALQASEKGSLLKEIGTIHMDLGYLYDEWGEYDKAQQSCQQAIEIFKVLGNNYGLSSAYLNLGRVFESKQELEAAVMWYDRSRNIFASINNPGGQAYACFLLGKVLRQQGKLAEAEDVLSEAVRLSKEFGLVETLSAAEQQVFQIKQLSK